MIVNVYCPSKDKSFCLNVGSPLFVKEFKMLCSNEIGAPASTIKLIFNNQPLVDDAKTLSSYNIAENDMVILDFISPSSSLSQNAPSLDFSRVSQLYLDKFSSLFKSPRKQFFSMKLIWNLPIAPRSNKIETIGTRISSRSNSNCKGIQVPPQARVPQPSAGLGRGTSTNSSNVPFPDIDFSQVRVPGRSSTAQPVQSPANNALNRSFSDPIAFRQAMLDNPQNMEVIRKIYPPVVEAILSGSEEVYLEEFFKMGNVLRRQQPLLGANPMDVEIQKKIAEEIERKNIEDNMTMAMEENPESFAQVVMLWINLKVNGHHVKAFVDSGAQMTIMSAACAQRCNIMRLVDKRWEGVAKGVGTQKIIGRIHLAQIQIEDVFLQCSFCVLEDQPMDVLLGLDMLRRHLCVIDLRENSLIIGTNNTKTRFLAETDLPSYGRLHDPDGPPGTSKSGQVSFCRRQDSNSSSSVAKVARKSSRPRSEQSETTQSQKESDEEPAEKVKKVSHSASPGATS